MKTVKNRVRYDSSDCNLMFAPSWEDAFKVLYASTDRILLKAAGAWATIGSGSRKAFEP